MAKTISNMCELNAALLPTMEGMVESMADRVYKTLNHFLHQYYDSYKPKSYRRTFDFLYSAVKVKPKRVGNSVVASVYIDYESMNNYYQASGHDVASWANEGLHGGLNVGKGTPHVWDDTMNHTVDNGQLLKLAVDYLRSKGFTVKS